MDSSRDVTGANNPYIPQDEKESVTKRPKVDPDSSEAKTSDTTKKVFEEDILPAVEKTSPTLKRGRVEEDDSTGDKKLKSKIATVAKAVMPYESKNPEIAEILHRDINDIPTKNRIKESLDALLPLLTDPVDHHLMLTIACLEPYERVELLETFVNYPEFCNTPSSSGMLLHRPFNQILTYVNDVKVYLSDNRDKRSQLFQVIADKNQGLKLHELARIFKPIIGNVEGGREDFLLVLALSKDENFYKVIPYLQNHGITDYKILLSVILLLNRKELTAENRDRIINYIQNPTSTVYLQELINVTANYSLANFQTSTNLLEFTELIACMILDISLLPPEKYETVQSYSLQFIDNKLFNLMPDFSFLASLSKEQFDNAFTLTKKFTKQFKVTTNKLFIPMTTLSLEDYNSIYPLLTPFIASDAQNKYNTNFVTFFMALAVIPTNDRQEIVNDCEKLLATGKKSSFFDMSEWATKIIESLKLLSTASRQAVISTITTFILSSNEQATLLKCIALLGEPIFMQILKNAEQSGLNHSSASMSPFIEELQYVVLNVPKEQVVDVIKYTAQILEGLEYPHYQFTRIINDIIQIDLSERDHVIQQVLFNINNQTIFSDRRYFIFYHYSYKIETLRTSIKDNSLKLLDEVTEKFSNHVAYRLRIIFTGEKGDDAGGLGRTFITELFEGLKTALHFQVGDNGLCMPNAELQLTATLEKQYAQLGTLIMFCLNATSDYPIGMIFDSAFFTALTSLNPEYLEQPIAEWLKTDAGFEKFFATYSSMYIQNENMKGTLNWMNENKDNPEAVETMKEMMVAVLTPLATIAKGMSQTNFTNYSFVNVQFELPEDLSIKLQGKVGKDMIIAALMFENDVGLQAQEWLKNWILHASDKDVALLLHSMTGSPALGKKPLLINACAGETVIFHTCDNRLEVPLSCIDSQDKFSFMLQSSFSSGFNLG